MTLPNAEGKPIFSYDDGDNFSETQSNFNFTNINIFAISMQNNNNNNNNIYIKTTRCQK